MCQTSKQGKVCQALTVVRGSVTMQPSPTLWLHDHQAVTGWKAYLEANGQHVGAHNDTSQFQRLALVGPAHVRWASLITCLE